ncbi:ABC transporter ATP-binding protein [Brevibacillus choshinensis]|uniref:ABC transporter ATP-binding protein n=1 Tax=Brevibacillus choshinensis TaxID=54911 RepID=A0ABX7FR74_BRECH|nr:ABC transporter ATP-binding protein [Brevibacillus choshinensis]QRG68672.1 ABC transporter ATP-binding protein [Brevibacillus choshinensis]
MKPLLEVDQLRVSFRTYGGEVQAVRGVSFSVREGETLAIVGESGCGKSVTARALMGMIPRSGQVKSGSIRYRGNELTRLTKQEWRQVRGSQIGMIFQDPMTSLNPTMKIGQQIAEGLIKHRKQAKAQAREEAQKLLEKVGISEAARRYEQYPHELSGGMRQRVGIAMALACHPQLIIADEPTTALDVTIQAQILRLMKELQEQLNTSIILITHDLGVVAELADHVAVMYAGVVVESGRVEEIFDNPRHPYTQGLLQSVPRLLAGKQERLIPIEGTPPDLFRPPAGCPFAARCQFAMEICLEHMPLAESFSERHEASCWLNDPRAQRAGAWIAAGRETHV